VRIETYRKNFSKPEYTFYLKLIIPLWILDGLTTIYHRVYFNRYELNPINRFFHETLGVIIGQIIKMLVIDLPLLLFFGLMVVTIIENSKKARRFFIISAIFYFLLISNNLILLI
jgi:hypothetical protein